MIIITQVYICEEIEALFDKEEGGILIWDI
jgi:hypothetical protein